MLSGVLHDTPRCKHGMGLGDEGLPGEGWRAMVADSDPWGARDGKWNSR